MVLTAAISQATHDGIGFNLRFLQISSLEPSADETGSIGKAYGYQLG